MKQHTKSVMQEVSTMNAERQGMQRVVTFLRDVPDARVLALLAERDVEFLANVRTVLEKR